MSTVGALITAVFVPDFVGEVHQVQTGSNRRRYHAPSCDLTGPVGDKGNVTGYADEEEPGQQQQQ